jgi:hypothetical protein
MPHQVPFLSIMGNKDKFFSKLSVGDLFVYSDGYLYADVEKMAGRRGLVLRYCPPKSHAYEKHGCMTVQVVQNKLIYEPQIFHFDIKHLDI